MNIEATLVFVVLAALFFDFTNGFHDAANAIATSVSTKALSPKVAVGMAGILNFAGAFVSLKVAATVAKGIVQPGSITLTVVLAGIIGAIAWNLITWRMGLPTSSSHALIGGVAGAAMAAVGFGAIQWNGLYQKVVLPSLASPLLGLVIAAALTTLISILIFRRRADHMPKIFRRLQVVSAGFVAFTHGTNDAQKTMGIIALALLAANPSSTFAIPTWVIVSSAAAMALGTYFGGWRIIRTLGHRISEIEPYQGLAAETSTASILWVTGNVGFPVSTTHTVTGSVLGAGVAGGRRRVRWGVARDILFAWLFTLPCAALAGALMQKVTLLPAGTVIAIGICVSLGVVAFLSRSRTAEIIELETAPALPLAS